MGKLTHLGVKTDFSTREQRGIKASFEDAWRSGGTAAEAPLTPPLDRPFIDVSPTGDFDAYFRMITPTGDGIHSAGSPDSLHSFEYGVPGDGSVWSDITHMSAESPTGIEVIVNKVKTFLGRCNCFA